MAKKRRTRKEKTRAKHQIKPVQVTGINKAKWDNSEANVKGQLAEAESRGPSVDNSKRLTINSAKNITLASVKKDLLKSLLFAILIIASEIMIYLVWY